MNALEARLAPALAGRYTIGRELGEGGMAIVFLAQDLRHDRQVALKVLRPEVSAEIGAERFLLEIKLAAGLTHPHILPVFDSGSADGMLFYVMPSMEGRSLRERLERERQLSLSDALRITREVASALDYAHRHNVVHRDIKPENILLHEGAAMVADFGIGKVLSATGRSLTQTGLAIGTPAYMSPEQSAGELSTDGRSDLYSLGCVLYEMLTGEPPFTGVSAQAIIAKRFVSPIPKVRTTRDVPEAVDSAVTRALARTPVDRYPTAADFAEALRTIGTQTTAQRTVSDPARTSTKAIAVLPFKNMSADPENEYFSDGMTEEIINALGKLQGMHVASRTSSFAFKGKDADVREIGDKLGVTTVLEGSVRKVGNRIRLTAQLINVESGYHLWNETYDRQLEDVFAVQDEISRAIVEALALRLGGEQGQVVAPTKNLEAYTLYLKGRFFFAKLSEPALRRSLELFQQALLHDPALARAYAGHRGRLVQSRRRLGSAGRRVSARQGRFGARAAARTGAGGGDHVARQGARLARVEVRGCRGAARARSGARAELRGSALRAWHDAAVGGTASGRDRHDAPGAHARSALGALQRMARTLSPLRWASSMPRSCSASTRWTWTRSAIARSTTRLSASREGESGAGALLVSASAVDGARAAGVGCADRARAGRDGAARTRRTRSCRASRWNRNASICEARSSRWATRRSEISTRRSGRSSARTRHARQGSCI